MPHPLSPSASDGQEMVFDVPAPSPLGKTRRVSCAISLTSPERVKLQLPPVVAGGITCPLVAFSSLAGFSSPILDSWEIPE